MLNDNTAKTLRAVSSKGKPEDAQALRGRIGELEKDLTDLQAELEERDRPWKGNGPNGTRTGDRPVLSSAQLRGAARYLADNNEILATGLMVILIEHFATLAFQRRFLALDSSVDIFRRWLCREQDEVLEAGIDRLRDDTFERLNRILTSDIADTIAELSNDLSAHNGLECERELSNGK